MSDNRIQAAAKAIMEYFLEEGGVVSEMDEYMRFSVDGMYLADDIARAAISSFLKEQASSQEILNAMMGGFCLPDLNLHLVKAMQNLYAAGYMVIRAPGACRAGDGK